MKNLSLKPEEAEALWRMAMGDLHMVDDEVFNRTMTKLGNYAEKYFEEKYSEEENN